MKSVLLVLATLLSENFAQAGKHMAFQSDE